MFKYLCNCCLNRFILRFNMQKDADDVNRNARIESQVFYQF